MHTECTYSSWNIAPRVFYVHFLRAIVGMTMKMCVLTSVTNNCCRNIFIASDFPIDRWKHTSLRGHLHRSWTEKNRKSVSSFFSHSGFICSCTRDDICCSKRLTRLLDVRCTILWYVDSIRRHVFNRLYTKSVRHFVRQIHTHQGSIKVMSMSPN